MHVDTSNGGHRRSGKRYEIADGSAFLFRNSGQFRISFFLAYLNLTSRHYVALDAVFGKGNSSMCQFFIVPRLPLQPSRD